jgi:hypothetical protein
LWLAAAYLTFGAAFQLTLGRPWPIRLTTPLFAASWLTATAIYFAANAAIDWRRTWRGVTVHRVASALLLAVCFVPIQITFQALKQSIGPILGFWWDQPLSAIDKLIHVGPAWRMFQPFMTQPFVRALDLLYMIWFPLLVAFSAWCCWTTHRALRERAILAWLLLWIGGGTIGAWLFSSGGPVYYAAIVGQPEPAYVELIEKLDTLGIEIARRNQQVLWTLHHEDRWGPFAGISAMPSLHVGVVALYAMVAWRRWVPAGMVAWMFVLVTQAGSVVLAWHYAIDGYVGVLLAWACWVLAGRWVDYRVGGSTDPFCGSNDRPERSPGLSKFRTSRIVGTMSKYDTETSA